ncbi:hypothetical protein ABN034_16375 [Actinopolymorpha sp. B11F2]|uniref:hypothetical protein n=1 Tax=Actinopolymorpha sp. B11F2 TaxID=3160862 RepID=UPI0032E3AE0F
MSIPDRKNMKTQLSRWENGHHTPSTDYQELWCVVYRQSRLELGFQTATADPDTTTEFVAKLAAGRSVGPETARVFLDQLDTIRAADRTLGAPATHKRLLNLIRSMQALLRHAVLPRGRAPLAAALADATALAGWQALDLGDVERAWELHESSKAAAREAGNNSSIAHAMAEQACVLIDLGCGSDAVDLVRATRDLVKGQVPRVLESWLLASEAEACAAAGDGYGARAAMDNAYDILPPDPNDELPYIFLQPVHMRRWRGNVLARIGDVAATEDLLRALAGMDPTFIRATAGLECDIAIAMVALGEPQEAMPHVARARRLAKQTGSVRQRRRAEQVVQSL